MKIDLRPFPVRTAAGATSSRPPWGLAPRCRNVKSLWTKNSEIAQRNGLSLEPQQFAEMVVDDNFLG